jgi:hypothetical protein
MNKIIENSVKNNFNSFFISKIGEKAHNRKKKIITENIKIETNIDIRSLSLSLYIYIYIFTIKLVIKKKT